MKRKQNTEETGDSMPKTLNHCLKRVIGMDVAFQDLGIVCAGTTVVLMKWQEKSYPVPTFVPGEKSMTPLQLRSIS